MFYLKVNDHIELKLLMLQDAEHVISMINSCREFLSKWLSWIDNTQKFDDVVKLIKKSHQQCIENNGFIAGVWYHKKLAGLICFHFFDWKNKKTSIGYCLDKKYEGKGIMLDSCKTFINFAFNDQNLNRVEIRCAEKNHKSYAIPEKLGFTKEGIIREGEYLNNTMTNILVYGILKKEWKRKLTQKCEDSTITNS